MKNRLSRPTSALFPLALLAADILGKQHNAALFLLFYFALQICSLCAVDCYRNAAAREIGPRRADKRFWASLPMLLIAPAPLIWLFAQLNDINTNYFIPIAGAWLIIIEQLFEERLFSLNRRSDANLLSLISNGLLFAGLMLDSMKGVPTLGELFYTSSAAGLGALIAMLTSLVILPPKGFSLIPKNILFAPKAMVQCLLFPLAWFALFTWNRDFDPDGTGFLTGLALWRLARTLYRRSADESRPMNFALMFITSTLIIGGCWLKVLVMPSFCAAMVLVCAMIVFLRPSVRNILGTLLIAGSFALRYFNLGHYYYNAPVIACCALAVILNLKHAFLKKV